MARASIRTSRPTSRSCGGCAQCDGIPAPGAHRPPLPTFLGLRETDLDFFLRRFFRMEVIERLKLEPARDLISRERLNARVIVKHVLVIKLSRVGDLLFGVRQLAL